MAINFGQQINQALGQSLNRVGDSRVRAQQLAEQMKQRKFNQQIKQQVQRLKEREFQLAQEAQDEEILHNAWKKRMEEEKEESLSGLRDARSKYYKNYNKTKDVSPSSLISGLQSMLKASSSALDAASDTRENFEEDNPLLGQEALSEPQRIREANENVLSAEEDDNVDEGIHDIFGNVNRSQITAVQEQLAQAKQDSARVQDELMPAIEQEQTARENIGEIQETLKGLISQLRGGSGNTNNSDVPTLTAQSESDNEVVVLTQQDLQEYADRHNITVERAREIWSNQEGYRVEG